jgi:hypothetical protein
MRHGCVVLNSRQILECWFHSKFRPALLSLSNIQSCHQHLYMMFNEEKSGIK